METDRLVPDYPFPAYAYVPGQFPHPVSDPAGHSFGAQSETVDAVDPPDWRQSRPYLIGIDLFNCGYYWEAHETWEGLWHACGRRGITATFLKGLIKLAAAGVKRRERRSPGMTSHPRRAREHFEEVRKQLPPGDPIFLGLSLDELIRFAECAEQLATVPLEGPIHPVEVVFPFVLRPLGML
jgi:uncharacterized protein